MNGFKNWKKPDFDIQGWAYKDMYSPLSYGWRCSYPENLKLGKNIDIGSFTYLNAREGITIEDEVQVGSCCSIYSIDTERNISGSVFIGKGSLIGAHVTIYPNSHIPAGSKIRAYSIIDKNKYHKVKYESTTI